MDENKTDQLKTERIRNIQELIKQYSAIERSMLVHLKRRLKDKNKPITLKERSRRIDIIVAVKAYIKRQEKKLNKLTSEQ